MRYTFQFRLWHWINAFIVLGLLGTVFLRKTFLSWRTNSELLIQKLADMDISITHDQAVILAKSIRAGMWEWHIYLGFALGFFLLYRVYLYVKDTSKREKFRDLDLHKKAVKALYYVVYLSLFFMAISGLIIYFYHDLGLSKEIAHNIKEVHEVVFNIILIFVPLHLGGVIIADNTNEKGLISTMINGRENNLYESK